MSTKTNMSVFYSNPEIVLSLMYFDHFNPDSERNETKTKTSIILLMKTDQSMICCEHKQDQERFWNKLTNNNNLLPGLSNMFFSKHV